MKIYNLLLIGSLFMIITTPLLSEEKYDMRPAVAVFDFRTVDCPASLGTQFADILKEELSARTEYRSIKTATISRERVSCFTLKSAVAYGRKLNAEKSIIGSVRIIKRKDIKTIADDREIYSVTVRIVNVKRRREEERYTRTGDAAHLKREIVSIARNIKIKGRDRAYDEATIAEDEESFFTGFSLTGISVSANYAQPQGDFTEMADNGYGLNLNIYGGFSSFRSFFLMLSLGYYTFNDLSENVESLQIASAGLSFGYSFTITRYVSFAPVAGFGYIAHIVDGKKNETGTERDYYFDPSASAGLEISFLLTQNYHLFFNTSYVIFFEKDSTGQYLGASIGVKMLL
jgi:hypothetical protein